MRVIAKMKGHLIMNLKKKRTIASVASAAIAAMAMTISVAAASFDFSLNVGEEDYSSRISANHNEKRLLTVRFFGIDETSVLERFSDNLPLTSA